MKKMYKFFKILFVVSLIFVSFSCTTTRTFEVPTLTKFDDMLFWKIEGTDAKGKTSTIYVLGTIHIGDEKLYPIPDVITYAFLSADRVYGEISTQGWKDLNYKTATRILKAKAGANVYKAETGLEWYDSFSDEQKNFLEEKLGSAVVESVKEYMPWVLNSSLSGIGLQGIGLTADYSYDMHFISAANENEIEMLGLDEIDVQLDILSYGDMDFQLKLIKSTIDEFLKNPDFEKEETIALYEAYLSGDEKLLESILFDNMAEEIAEIPEMQGYYDVLFLNRNTNWAETFAQLIEDGGNTFVFAGSGHFVGENSVFEIMKQNGDLIF